MEERFGSGGFRPLPRHLVWQHGKWRPIDDGKRAGTNALSNVEETLVNVPSIILLLIIKMLQTLIHGVDNVIPEWADVSAAVEDWWKGYRQLFPSLKHMAFNVIALLDPKARQWKYAVLRGLPFGLGAAVNQFNRVPALLTAAARRLLYIMSAHYVDDNAIVDFTALRG